MTRTIELTKEDRNILDEICSRIESRYCECVASYGEFTNPVLDCSDDGMVGFHVFSIAEQDCSDAHKFIFGLIKNVIRERKLPLAFSIWDKEQTLEYFAEDFEFLKRQARSSWVKGEVSKELIHHTQGTQKKVKAKLAWEGFSKREKLGRSEKIFLPNIAFNASVEGQFDLRAA